LFKIEPRIRQKSISLWDISYDKHDSLGTRLGDSYPDVEVLIQKLREDKPLSFQEVRKLLNWRGLAGTIFVRGMDEYQVWHRLIQQVIRIEEGMKDSSKKNGS